jgi:hypothetical protein
VLFIALLTLSLSPTQNQFADVLRILNTHLSSLQALDSGIWELGQKVAECGKRADVAEREQERVLAGRRMR